MAQALAPMPPVVRIGEDRDDSGEIEEQEAFEDGQGMTVETTTSVCNATNSGSDNSLKNSSCTRAEKIQEGLERTIR